MKKKVLNILSLLTNGLIVYLILSAFWVFLTGDGVGNMRVSGWMAFRYFTVDSNALAALAALIMVFYNLKALKTGENQAPRSLHVFRLIGTAGVTLTFLTVILYLGNASSFKLMLSGKNFYMHLLGPFLAFLAFTVFEAPCCRITWKETLYPFILVLLYAGLYYYMVIHLGPKNGGWPDFYFFNTNGNWLKTFVIIVPCAYLVCAGLMALRNFFNRKFSGE